MLGFCLDVADKNFVNPAVFQAITEWVAGVRLIGELPTADAQAVADLRLQYNLDGLQLNHTADWPELKATGLTLVCRVPWRPGTTLEAFREQYDPVKPYADFFLLESDAAVLSPETLYELQRVAEHFPVLLGFGLDSGTVLQTLADLPLAGVALNGGQEVRPGYRDFGDLAEILETLEDES